MGNSLIAKRMDQVVALYSSHAICNPLGHSVLSWCPEPALDMVMQVADLLRKRAEGSTDWEEFEDCGHVPMDEYPAKFNQTIVPFIAKTFSQASQLPSLDRLASDDPVPSLPVFPASEVTPVKQI